MKKRYVQISALMAMMVFLLTGCGAQLPSMTPEEEQIVGEYAAKLLLKYDANNRSRLVSRDEVVQQESEQQTLENTIPESTQEGMEPVEDTPVIEIGQEVGAVSTTGSLEGIYELADGIKIVYHGNEVCDSYAGGEDISAYFSLDASAGKQLLVLKFRVENQSQEDRKLDMLSKNVMMKAIVNDSNTYNVLTTMLMDDLSTYMGDIPVGGSIDTVLLVEIDNETASNISSIWLEVTNDSQTYTIQLQ